MEIGQVQELWRTLGMALLTLIAVWGAHKFVGLLYKYVWLPRGLKRAMERQGIRGPAAEFLVGNVRERNMLVKEALSKDMEVGDYNIVGRVMPQQVAWTQQYGKNYMWWLGPQLRVTITDPEHIKEIMSDKEDAFTKGALQLRGTRGLLGKGLVGVVGDEWALHRRVVSPAFQHEKIKLMMGAMEQSTLGVLNELEKKVQEGGGCAEVEMQEHMVEVTYDIISRTAFGSSYEKGKKVFQQQRDLANLFVTRGNNTFLFVPGFRSLPTQINMQVAKLQKELKRSLTEIVQGRKDVVKTGQRESYGNDLLGLVLLAADEEMSLKNGKVHFGMQDLIDECKTFFFAGHETTATLLTWTLMLLGRHTEWQDRARAEVLEVCGDANQPLDVDALVKLKSLTWILNESLRLFPPVTAQGRQATRDLTLGDIKVPKGIDLFMPKLVLHHDPELWGEDVHEFKPDRFADGVAKASKHHMAFSPFSFGPRFCVGQNFALQEAKVVMALLLQRFRFRLSPQYRHAPELALLLSPKYGMPLLLEKIA